jgi:two-component system response regulator AtoC/two-component system nitrogen regulation response regulator NtrX
MADINSSLILLVDDSEVSNFLMQSILEERGYSILSVSNGKDALDFLKQQQPNLIILDIMMPEMNGFGVLESVKKFEATAKIPVMILTARNNLKDQEKAISMGAADYMIKPIDIDDVVERVSRLMNSGTN